MGLANAPDCAAAGLAAAGLPKLPSPLPADDNGDDPADAGDEPPDDSGLIMWLKLPSVPGKLLEPPDPVDGADVAGDGDVPFVADVCPFVAAAGSTLADCCWPSAGFIVWLLLAGVSSLDV